MKKIGIPNKITKIDYYTFARCGSLTNVVIPKNIIKIEYGAFYECTALESVSILHDGIEIKDSAFEKCLSLENVTIPSRFTTLEGDDIFKQCPRLVIYGRRISDIHNSLSTT